MYRVQKWLEYLLGVGGFISVLHCHVMTFELCIIDFILMDYLNNVLLDHVETIYSVSV